MKKLRKVCEYIPYLTPFSLWGLSKLCDLLQLGSKVHIFVCVLLTFINILAIIFTIVIDIKTEESKNGTNKKLSFKAIIVGIILYITAMMIAYWM